MKFCKHNYKYLRQYIEWGHKYDIHKCSECGKEIQINQKDKNKVISKINKSIKDAISYDYINESLISDTYHTFGELYEFRKIYNALLFNEWCKNKTITVYKSKRHSDGELCFGGGWFIVVAILPMGQITNHYELKEWDLFKIPEFDRVCHDYDGHTPQDTLVRMTKYIEDK